MHRRLLTFGGAFMLVWLAACSAQSAPMKTGEQAPGWSNLPGVDGQKHSLDQYKDAKVIVMVFTCNHCPVAVAYEDRLVALDRKYSSQGVKFIAVNVNKMPADRLDKMQERAKAKGFAFPYLFDESQKIGHDFGAKVTPHIFVLDQNRKVAYVGAIDDNMKAGEVKTHYLSDAIDALLAGKSPSKQETKAVGCSIKYED